MFTEARTELRELLDLVHRIATFDATLAADRSIQPEATALERRRGWELRSLALQSKYERIGRDSR